MASTILLDEHLDGFVLYLESLTFSDYWREVAEWLSLRFVRLSDVGLIVGTSDRDIWHFCQDRGLYLMSDNRSQSTADSLGAVIAAEGAPESLAVFTIGDLDRFRKERTYGEAVAKSLLQHLFEPDSIRGAGRLFLP